MAKNTAPASKKLSYADLLPTFMNLNESLYE